MDDIYARFDFGYDPDTVEDCPVAAAPPPAASLPPRATVNPAWLPPVGRQTTPSCFAWSAIYGLATYKAARAGNRTPSEPSLQASPHYAYIKIMETRRTRPGTCTGGRISWCFDLLQANDGTPSLEQAPAPKAGHDPCQAAWRIYGRSAVVSDYAFSISGGSRIDVTGPAGLDAVRGQIVQGRPLAYGTRLFTDFVNYGDRSEPPIPYVGNGQLQKTPGGQVAGHCMMIIGYDDGLGAVLLQNSFGSEWGIGWNGSRGYVWMAYGTFQHLAQGSACLIDPG